jgi:hypothetical protein
MRTLFVCLFAAAALQAETYKLTLAQRSEVAGNVLQPGDYKLEVEGSKACFRLGKHSVEVPVHSEPAQAMATRTVIAYHTAGAMYRITRVEPKGTQLRLVF